MPAIILSTLNARYAHAAFGLRCLRANLGALRDDSVIIEFVIGQRTEEIVETLLAARPRLIGFGVYIWNVEPLTRVVAMLKAVAPEITIVVGGPEVSHEIDVQPICRAADFVVTGWGDLTFGTLARQILHGPRPLMKVHAGVQPDLAELASPYGEYTDTDLRQRHIYVEASRGCPFKCEFCLSALDKTAWPFPLEPFLADLAALWARGARQFKFVDRTFNLRIDASRRILEFFLGKIAAAPQDPPFVHFELIPDHLPAALQEVIVKFPPGTLQFEVGIQTWNPDVQHLISRRQDNDAAAANLRWLRTQTNAHLHVDLIAGLPGEDLASFGAGFDRLVALAPHEIQVGILKRLRGAPIARHTAAFDLRFSPDPPYPVLATDRLDFATLQRLNRFARYWDLTANSGRFTRAVGLLLGAAPFARFLGYADWLYARTGQTHAIAIERQYNLLRAYLVECLSVPAVLADAALTDDYLGSGARGKLDFVDIEALRGARTARPGQQPRSATTTSAPARQSRHLAAR